MFLGENLTAWVVLVVYDHDLQLKMIDQNLFDQIRTARFVRQKLFVTVFQQLNLRAIFFLFTSIEVKTEEEK